VARSVLQAGRQPLMPMGRRDPREKPRSPGASQREYRKASACTRPKQRVQALQPDRRGIRDLCQGSAGHILFSEMTSACFRPSPVAAVLRFTETKLMPLAYRHTLYLAISPSTVESIQALRVSKDQIRLLVEPGVDMPPFELALPNQMSRCSSASVDWCPRSGSTSSSASGTTRAESLAASSW
jgi:hypothetical protein